MKFFDTIGRARGKEDDTDDEHGQNHISEIVQRLGRDETEREFDEDVRMGSSADTDDNEDFPVQSAEEGEEGGQEREVLHLSPQMSNLNAFKQVSDDLETQLQHFAERIALSKRTWASLKPYVDQFEVDIRRSDLNERDRNAIAQELRVLKKAHARTSKDLALKVGELAASNVRNSELRQDVAKLKQLVLEANAENERLKAEGVKTASDLSYLRSDVALLSAQLERETVAKENAEHARLELASKFAKLQQVETQTRNRAIEISLQNEKLMSQLPALIAEQEDLHNQLRTANRDRGELENRLMSAQDTISQLESEVQAMQAQSASEAYTARTELEVAQAELRTALHTTAEAELRLKEAQAQLREAEAWRQSAEYDIAALERDLGFAKREASASVGKISDLNVKYMTDLLSLDQAREQNKQLQQNMEALLTENRRLAKFEALYKAAETQITGLRSRVDLLAQSGGTGTISQDGDGADDADDDRPGFSAANDEVQKGSAEAAMGQDEDYDDVVVAAPLPGATARRSGGT